MANVQVQHLNWQSCFWAITALAANTMSQDSGSFNKHTDLERYILRSSPIFCLFDLFTVTSCFISLVHIGSWSRGSYKPLEAIRATALLRYPSSDEARKKSGTLASQVKSLILLIIALAQALKLWACGGIPWTKAFAIIFMLSYLVEGVLHRIIATTPDEDSEALLERNYNVKSWATKASSAFMVAGVLQFYLWTSIIFHFLPETIDHFEDNMSQSSFIGQLLFRLTLSMLVRLLTLILIIGGLFVSGLTTSVLLLEYCSTTLERFISTLKLQILKLFRTRLGKFGFLLVGFVTILSYAVLCDWFIYWVGELKGQYRLVLAHLLSSLMFLLLFTSFRICSRHRVLARLVIDTSGRDIRTMYVYLAGLGTQVVTTAIYYAYVYDPQGTHQPSWTQILG